MRRRAWAAIGLAAAFVASSLLIAKAKDVPDWIVGLNGLLLVAAIVLALSLVDSIWSRAVQAVPAMPGLWARPPPSGWWCAACGLGAARTSPCKGCGAAAPGARRRKRGAATVAAGRVAAEPAAESAPQRSSGASAHPGTPKRNGRGK